MSRSRCTIRCRNRGGSSFAGGMARLAVRLAPGPFHRAGDGVDDMLVGMEPLDDMLRASGQYGPKVEVSDDADEQVRLIAFTGRQP